MIGGAAQMALAFLPGETSFIAMMILLALVVGIPTVYSFLLARKQGQI